MEYPSRKWKCTNKEYINFKRIKQCFSVSFGRPFLLDLPGPISCRLFYQKWNYCERLSGKSAINCFPFRNFSDIFVYLLPQSRRWCAAIKKTNSILSRRWSNFLKPTNHKRASWTQRKLSRGENTSNKTLPPFSFVLPTANLFHSRWPRQT